MSCRKEIFPKNLHRRCSTGLQICLCESWISYKYLSHYKEVHISQLLSLLSQHNFFSHFFFFFFFFLRNCWHPRTSQQRQLVNGMWTRINGMWMKRQNGTILGFEKHWHDEEVYTWLQEIIIVFKKIFLNKFFIIYTVRIKNSNRQ